MPGQTKASTANSTAATPRTRISHQLPNSSSIGSLIVCMTVSVLPWNSRGIAPPDHSQLPFGLCRGARDCPRPPAQRVARGSGTGAECALQLRLGLGSQVGAQDLAVQRL